MDGKDVGLILLGAGITVVTQLILEKIKQLSKAQAFCSGVATELETLWAHHMNMCGKHLDELKPDEIFQYIYQIEENYFGYYESTQGSLGLIRDETLRSEILITYIKLKSLADTFRAHNLYIAKYNDENKNVALNVDTLRASTSNLLELQATIKNRISTLVHSLREYAEWGHVADRASLERLSIGVSFGAKDPS